MERQIIDLCRGWQFRKDFRPEDIFSTGQGFESICLPHTVRELPLNYLDETSYQIHSCYRRVLDLDPGLRGHRLYLDFAGVMTACWVYVNGKELCFHKGGYTPFSVEITDAVKFDGQDLLILHVDSTERKDTPPFGYVVDYLCFGGVYREVSLRAVPRTYVEDVFCRPEQVLSGSPSLRVDTRCVCQSPAVLQLSLWQEERRIAAAEAPVSAGENTVTLTLPRLSGIQLWTPENPVLYRVEAVLTAPDSQDVLSVRTGFRTAEFTADGFLLNGEPRKLLGLNRHQQYPYVGYAMPRRAQQQDADILRKELGINLVRTSHYPQAVSFLDRCDEIGLMVFTELPGWQHIGDQQWQDQACQDLEALILRDRNHPAIILWGVRINESPDNHDFYVRTNALAHRLDPTRQTGGVRCCMGSELLEDVYTYNDFSHNGGELVFRDQREITGRQNCVPYLVTENNGHIFPTKRFDNENRVVEHALRHLRVLNAASADPHSCGMTAWCAFDYNTHKDFGSGDKICYHGVMDMFRLPKFAAAAYSSQQEAHPVLEPATYWCRGDRDEAIISPIWVMTNCDYVMLNSSGQEIGPFYPDRKTFPALRHPPVAVECPENGWGIDMSSAVFTGFLNGSPVIRKHYTASPLPTALTLKADCTTLHTGPWDTTRVVCRLVDSCGNSLPFSFVPVHFSAEGPASVIGPEHTCLIGGQLAFWIRTHGTPGTVTLRAEVPGFRSEPVTVTVESAL